MITRNLSGQLATAFTRILKKLRTSHIKSVWEKSFPFAVCSGSDKIKVDDIN